MQFTHINYKQFYFKLMSKRFSKIYLKGCHKKSKYSKSHNKWMNKAIRNADIPNMPTSSNALFNSIYFYRIGLISKIIFY